jgi:hypothetical protein
MRSSWLRPSYVVAPPARTPDHAWFDVERRNDDTDAERAAHHDEWMIKGRQ